MTEKDQNQEQPESTCGAQSPMEMGMGMAKKMMALTALFSAGLFHRHS